MDFNAITALIQAAVESPERIPATILFEGLRKAAAGTPQFTGGHVAFLKYIGESMNVEFANLGMDFDISGMIGTPRYNDYLIALWFLSRDPKVIEDMKAQLRCGVVGVADSMQWATDSLCQQYPHFKKAWNKK